MFLLPVSLQLKRCVVLEWLNNLILPAPPSPLVFVKLLFNRPFNNYCTLWMLASSQVLPLNNKLFEKFNTKCIIIIIKGLKTPTGRIQPVSYLQVQLRTSIGAGDKLVLRSAAWNQDCATQRKQSKLTYLNHTLSVLIKLIEYFF